uniref:VWFC domain-containing protein n=1 Tax=Branchiostoma floridae TaxID=7739 RepID=C3YLX9_BRAFL|eukprot:XP_002602561.1 hypothetical protein BRAFLDRAFT_127169 [Branchiostoma floridae]
MFQLIVLLVWVTVASAATIATRPTTTFRPTTTYFVPGCESQMSWPTQHGLGETWHEQFEGFCQDCICLATGKQCEPCPPRECFRPMDMLYGHGILAAGESAIIELSPDNCVLCHCQDYWAQCNDYPCDGIIA